MNIEQIKKAIEYTTDDALRPIAEDLITHIEKLEAVVNDAAELSNNLHNCSLSTTAREIVRKINRKLDALEQSNKGEGRGSMNKKNPDYLAWIREQPCIVCDEQSEPHHVRIDGNAGTGIKPDDTFCLPLCREHHTELHSRGQQTFFAKYFYRFQVVDLEDALEIDIILHKKLYAHTMRYIQEKMNV